VCEKLTRSKNGAAEAEREAIADAQMIVAICDARQVGGLAVGSV
jgi:hypothetical protein